LRDLARLIAMRMTGRAILWAVLAAAALPAHAVQIDGRLDPDEWQGAQHVTEFRKVQPLNGDPATLATEAWILATPGGLAVAFRNTQPASVPLTLQHVQRDFTDQVDRVNVMVDFDGDHRTGYDFTISCTDGISDSIITNENQFNNDWDGNWQHAVSRDADGWTVEVLIPWHIAPMRSAGEKRTLRVYLDRVIGSTGERAGWPFASFERPRFLADFAAVEVTNYSQSLLAITPYVSGLYDNVGKGSDGNAGADVFWKPNGQFQLSGTIKPDFGQVESDDLVVNFGATETFISDKRPFFTENQGIFEYTTPSDFSQLLYTRRVGGPADDGNGAGDITAALKLNGSVGSVKYGLFGADEADAVGRTFAVARVVSDFGTQNLGLMTTWVERPFLDRQATTLGIDHDWHSGRWNVQSRVFGSDIKDSTPGGPGDSRDLGATLWADYEMEHGWRQQVIAMHFGDTLDINDAGYLQRNNEDYLHWQINRRFTDLPADSRYASKDWRWRLSSDHNDHGLLLGYQTRLSRESRLRNGSYEYAQININSAGYDDLLTRGNGPLWLPSNFNTYFDYQRPRVGRWSYEVQANLNSGGLSGNHRLNWTLDLEPKYFISDAFNVYAGVKRDHNPDWLVWQHDNLIGSFYAYQTQINAGFNWIVTNRHELRLKLQVIALTADLRQAYRVENGSAVPTSEPVSDFSVDNLGVQLRYRYEFRPLSYLYVVYARGGYEEQDVADDTGSLIRNGFQLRDAEQFFVKFSYRFEN